VRTEPLAIVVHKKCEAWRDWLLERSVPSTDLLWKGVMNLMFYCRDNPKMLLKIKDWSERVETAMTKKGYSNVG
jgi:hypothetical protein